MDSAESEADVQLRLEQLRSLLHCIKFHTGVLVTHPTLLEDFDSLSTSYLEMSAEAFGYDLALRAPPARL